MNTDFLRPATAAGDRQGGEFAERNIKSLSCRCKTPLLGHVLKLWTIRPRRGHFCYQQRQMTLRVSLVFALIHHR